MTTRAFMMAVALAFALGARAEVLIVADEFPAMQALAGQLKAEEQISSSVVAQTALPAQLSSFSAIIVYIHKDLSQAAENALIHYTTNGGKLLLLHHSISSGKRKNARWFEFLGVALPERDVEHGGYKWIEGVTWELVNRNPDHFIMTNRVQYPTNILFQPDHAPASSQRTLPGFRLEHSEVYLNHVLTGPRTLLMGLKFQDPKRGVLYQQDTAGWLKPAGKGSVTYLMPGHTWKDFENVAYGRIVLNAVIYKP